MNISDPATFFVLALAVGLVLAGIYFALREVIADAILLAEKKKKVNELEERNKR